MSSFSKTGFARKAGKVAIGVALLSSLALTACSAPASKGDNKADTPSSASASASAAPQFDRFKSEAFDLSKQVSVSLADLNSTSKKEAIFLGTGVVGQKKDGDKTSVIFIPYEDADKAWTYTPSASRNVLMNLMRWKGKSYIVALETVNESKPASGMQAAKDTTTENVVVLDATNGKVVNTFKGEPVEIGKGSDTNNYHLDNIVRKDASPRDKDFVRPFMVGLVYINWTGNEKLVDPVTGETVAADKLNGNGAFAELNNESGFISDMNTMDYMTNNETFMKGIFGNFALMETSIPSEDGGNTGGRAYNTFSLVNTVTGKTVSTPMKCASAGHGLNGSNYSPVYSSDFRYVKFAGNYVFDTQTGASFCDTPKDNKTMRELPISALDNEGNMYGLAQRDYLRVSLTDPAKAETLVGDVSMSEDELPIVITDKGSAVFWMDESKKTIVTVPAKSGTKG